MPLACVASSASAIWSASRPPPAAVGDRADRLALDVFHDEVIGPDVEERADVRMIERRNGSRFPLGSARWNCSLTILIATERSRRVSRPPPPFPSPILSTSRSGDPGQGHRKRQ